MSDFLEHTWGLGTDQESYYLLQITPEELIWISGPLSESYTPTKQQRQSFEEFIEHGAPEGVFQEKMDAYPVYSETITEAIETLVDSGEFILPEEPGTNEQIWIDFNQILSEDESQYTPLLPFRHNNWVYEPGVEFSDSDGNMENAGVYFSEMEELKMKGYYEGEVLILTGFMDVTDDFE